MTESREPDELLAQIRRELDASTERLDELTVARLRAARARALDAPRAKRPFEAWRWLVPLAGVATATVIVMALVRPNLSAPDGATLPSEGDIELISAAAPLELLEELEFYEWLATTATPDAG